MAPAPGCISTLWICIPVGIFESGRQFPSFGSASGVYAAPFLSGNNGNGFGPGGTNQPDGQDTTVYVSAGSNAAPTPNAQVEIIFPGIQSYLGLLWGSVDSYNTIAFYNGASLVGTFTGASVLANPSGDQGLNGTRYVNIISDAAGTDFNRIVLTSSQFAFEVDNLAFSPTVPVPEPASIALLGMGLLGLGMVRRRRAPRA